MAFQEVNPDTWTYENEGDAIEGKLVKVKKDVGPNNATLYSIQQNDGMFKSVWGATVLDQRMALVEVGSKVRITFKGLGEKKGSKNAPKLFKVEIDNSQD